MDLLWLCWNFNCCKGNINSAKHIDILENNLWPVIVWYFEDKDYLFMENNAPANRAHSVENYKDHNEIAFMNSLAQSPHLNLIENIWLYIKRQLQKSTANITTKNDLFRAIQSMWQQIDLEWHKEASPLHSWSSRRCH